jgi:hypothetical protein
MKILVDKLITGLWRSQLVVENLAVLTFVLGNYSPSVEKSFIIIVPCSSCELDVGDNVWRVLLLLDVKDTDCADVRALDRCDIGDVVAFAAPKQILAGCIFLVVC